MRKLIAALLLLIWPGLMCSAQRSMFFAQNVNTLTVGTPTIETGCALSATSCTTGTMTAGDAVFISYQEGSLTTPTITDSLGGTVTVIGTQQWVSGGLDTLAYEKNAVAGAHKFTISAGGGSYPTLLIVAVRHADTTSPRENYAMTFGASNGTTINGTSVTSTTTGAMILSFASIGNGSAILSAGTGYAASSYTPATNSLSESIVGAAGAYIPTFNVSGYAGSTWLVDSVAIKAGP